MYPALNVIEVDNPDVFDYFILPEQHHSTRQYIESQFNQLRPTIMESGRKFIEEARGLYERFYDNTVERAAKAAVRIATGLLHPNSIQRFSTLEDIQSAAPLMQRYIMADPFIRQKYNDQLCSGFAGSYVDTDPNVSGPEHYDWRRVNSGVVRFEGTGENERFVATIYSEDLREGDRELTAFEKFDVLDTQELAVLFAKQGKDPTCQFGSSMG